VLVLEEGGKPENLGKNPLSKARTNNIVTQRTYGTEPESNLGHIVGTGEHSYHCTIPAPHNLHVHDVCT